jgi:putative addiction module CopG family antidote
MPAKSGYIASMTVTMPKELEDFVARKVQSGDFHDANEVICAAVRQLSEQQQDWEQDTPELREFLLASVKGSHQTLKLEELEQLEQRILAERRK